MNRDIFKGKWLQVKGSMRERLGSLTDNHAETASGAAERLAGLLQEEYGHAIERIRQENPKWQDLVESKPTPTDTVD